MWDEMSVWEKIVCAQMFTLAISGLLLAIGKYYERRALDNRENAGAVQLID